MFLAFVLTASDVLVLKDRTSASGRYVTLVELLREDKLDVAAREAVRGVYLGRAPETGERVITAEEIVRELRRRNLGTYTVQGEKVVVTPPGGEPRMGEWSREALAFEIKCHLITTRRMKGGDFSVRITFVEPEAVPAGFAVAAIQPRDESDPQRAEYTVVLEDEARRRMVLAVIARVLAVREVAFATRDLLGQRLITREDFELRRVEVEEDGRYLSDADLLVGARTVVKVKKGAALTRDELKLKPVVRRGDVVRARHRYVEADARVVDEGAVGDVVWLEWKDTGTRFRGRVVGPREVRVVEEERR